ncbi:MAG: hypothetical protein HC777_02790 [Hyphomonadaceae bacterium]|nr:hypothetical protein [Hyphomonadaceae bacterium]
MGGNDLLGIGFSRETQTLQPDRIVRMRGTQSFSLDEPAEVVVSINGRIVTRRAFAPGNYDISDFPLLVGRNQVELDIISQSGRRETLSFDQFIDTRLLDEGRDDFGLAIGIASRLGNRQQRLYDASDWVLNGYYLKGFSQRLTLGIATTISERRRNVLTTGVYAGATGVVSARLGLNSGSGQRQLVGGIGVVQARTDPQFNRSSANLRMSFDARLDLNNTADPIFNASIGHSRPISKRASAVPICGSAIAAAALAFKHPIASPLTCALICHWIGGPIMSPADQVGG